MGGVPTICRGKLVAPRATHFRITDESKRKFPLEEMSSICSIIFTSFLVVEIRRKHTVAVDTVLQPRNDMVLKSLHTRFSRDQVTPIDEQSQSRNILIHLRLMT